MPMPLKFESVKELENKIDEYFKNIDESGKAPTITGLAYALDTTRRTLLDYKEKDEFSLVIKKAKTRIEMFNEEQLYNRNVPTTGVIFNLKNNYGWVDKQENEISGITNPFSGLTTDELRKIAGE